MRKACLSVVSRDVEGIPEVMRAIGVCGWYDYKVCYSSIFLILRTSHSLLFSSIILKNLWFSYLKKATLCSKSMFQLICCLLHSHIFSLASSCTILDKYSFMNPSNCSNTTFSSCFIATAAFSMISDCDRQNQLSMLCIFSCYLHEHGWIEAVEETILRVGLLGEEQSEALNIWWSERMRSKRPVKL